MTFKEYVTKNNLLEQESTQSIPLPGIEFQVFDFKSTNLNDGVYFSMAIRKIAEE